MPPKKIKRRGPKEQTGGLEAAGRVRSIPSIARDLPSEDLAGEMYCAANRLLTSHGFEHYEISSYARLPPGAPPAGGEDDGARLFCNSRIPFFFLEASRLTSNNSRLTSNKSNNTASWNIAI